MLTAPQPFQTLQTRGISTPGQFVPGIAQKMHAAPLPQRGRQHFRDRMLQSLMTVRDHILDSPQATFLQMRQEFRPRPLAFPVHHFRRQHLTPTLAVNPEGNLHRRERTEPSSRTCSYRASSSTYGYISSSSRSANVFRDASSFDTMAEIVAGENS